MTAVCTYHTELAQVRLMQRYNQHIAGLFLSAIEPGHEKLLDFGAGSGTIATIVRPQTKNAELLCVEIDPSNLAALKQAGFRTASNLSFVEPESIDFVFSSNVLEHIEDDVGALKALYHCLKSGGRAAFYVPALPVLWSAMDDRVAHRRRYTRSSLEGVFRCAGFTIEGSSYRDSLGFFVTLLFKLIGNREGRLSPTALLIYDRLIFPLSQACDAVCSPFFGKNVLIYARKP
jgi:SAM-dependent methyltransferase